MDVNRHIRNYLPGHNNTLKKKERKQVPCECGCGTLIWNWDKYCNGPNRFVKGHSMRGELSPSWTGGRSTTPHGYILINVMGKRRREHRKIWEKHYNACLLPWADVHHKNKVRADNRIENL